MMFARTPIAKRRWANFKANKRACWSLWIFSVLFGISLFAELVANDKPLLISFNGEFRMPITTFYSEVDFGGEFETEAEYTSPEVQCLIVTGGLLDPCIDDPEGAKDAAQSGSVGGIEVTTGWMVWPPIPYSFDTINYNVATAPSAPDANHWLGTDDQTRSVMARIIYGFRISVLFALVTVVVATTIGVLAGGAMGFYGGWVDLLFQRIEEIWSSMPLLYTLIIVSAILTMNFWLLAFIVAILGWMGAAAVVRAEFLRARNLEYVRAARALGVGNWTIMFRHMLPNAMVGTLTFLPFSITGAVGTLTTLDFLGFGLPITFPSLGELALQAKNNLQAPHLGFAAFFTITIMLSLLVFIFEGVRDAYDPRKTFK